MGRGAGGAGRHGRRRRAAGRRAPAVAVRRGRAGLRLRAEAGARAAPRAHARRPQHARHHFRPARVLPEPAGTPAYLRCDRDRTVGGSPRRHDR